MLRHSKRFFLDTANGFSHKESEVRDATKDLIIALSQRSLHPKEIMNMLGDADISERQLREYQIIFDEIQYSKPVGRHSH